MKFTVEIEDQDVIETIELQAWLAGCTPQQIVDRGGVAAFTWRPLCGRAEIMGVLSEALGYSDDPDEVVVQRFLAYAAEQDLTGAEAIAELAQSLNRGEIDEDSALLLAAAERAMNL